MIKSLFDTKPNCSDPKTLLGQLKRKWWKYFKFCVAVDHILLTRITLSACLLVTILAHIQSIQPCKPEPASLACKLRATSQAPRSKIPTFFPYHFFLRNMIILGKAPARLRATLRIGWQTPGGILGPGSHRSVTI